MLDLIHFYNPQAILPDMRALQQGLKKIIILDVIPERVM